MSQASDLDVVNGSGAEVRAAINAALKAVASDSAGSQEPKNPFPWMRWADTGADRLKIRSADNTGWSEVQVLSTGQALGDYAQPVSQGGTGAKTAPAARSNLGLKGLATRDKAGTDQLEDAGVTLAKLADGPAGHSLVYDDNGRPVAVKSAAQLVPSKRCVALPGGHEGAIGNDIGVFLMEDGTVKACGTGSSYANGGWGSHLYEPTLVPFSEPVVGKKLYYSGSSGYVIDDQGRVFSWGYNNYGQLGHGDLVNRSVATLIQYFVDNSLVITDIFVPENSYYQREEALFLTDQGHLYACGYGGSGTMGDGSTSNSSIPKRVADLTGVVGVCTSGHPQSVHAWNAAGELWSWGFNNFGQLGLGHTADQLVPVKSDLMDDVKKVVAVNGADTNGANARGSSFLLRNDGTLWATGKNGYGQLGKGDTSDINVWTKIEFPAGVLIADVVANDGYYTCVAAVSDTKELYGWGYNGYGQLGAGDTVHKHIPFKPSAQFQGKVERINFVGTISYSGLVVESEKQLYAAGYNGNGGLGVGDTTSSSSWRRVLGLPVDMVDWRPMSKSSTGGVRVLGQDGRAYACGDNNYGRLGVQSANIHDQVTLAEVRL